MGFKLCVSANSGHLRCSLLMFSSAVITFHISVLAHHLLCDSEDQISWKSNQRMLRYLTLDQHAGGTIDIL